MNARTKLDPAGKVQLPKDVLKQLGFEPGQVLEVVPSAAGILLRRPFVKSGRSTEELIAELRKIAKYDGPPIPVEELNFPNPEYWQDEH